MADHSKGERPPLIFFFLLNKSLLFLLNAGAGFVKELKLEDTEGLYFALIYDYKYGISRML